MACPVKLAPLPRSRSQSRTGPCAALRALQRPLAWVVRAGLLLGSWAACLYDPAYGDADISTAQCELHRRCQRKLRARCVHLPTRMPTPTRALQRPASTPRWAMRAACQRWVPPRRSGLEHACHDALPLICPAATPCPAAPAARFEGAYLVIVKILSCVLLFTVAELLKVRGSGGFTFSCFFLLFLFCGRGKGARGRGRRRRVHPALGAGCRRRSGRQRQGVGSAPM